MGSSPPNHLTGSPPNRVGTNHRAHAGRGRRSRMKGGWQSTGGEEVCVASCSGLDEEYDGEEEQAGARGVAQQVLQTRQDCKAASHVAAMKIARERNLPAPSVGQRGPRRANSLQAAALCCTAGGQGQNALSCARNAAGTAGTAAMTPIISPCFTCTVTCRGMPHALSTLVTCTRAKAWLCVDAG